MDNENNKNRIYGIDPGCIKDVDAVNDMNEVDLWLTIDALGYHIWYCNHAMAHNRIKHVDLTEEQYAIEYLVNQTKKFGVELSDPEIGKHVQQTPSYLAWYSFYNKHFKEVLSKEQWDKFMIAKQNNEDISQYLPEGSWKDSMQNEKTKRM